MQAFVGRREFAGYVDIARPHVDDGQKGSGWQGTLRIAVVGDGRDVQTVRRPSRVVPEETAEVRRVLGQQRLRVRSLWIGDPDGRGGLGRLHVRDLRSIG
jgi:hypothetical protein